MSDPIELRPEFNKALREVSGINPYSQDPHTAPRPSLGLVWQLHLGAITLALVTVLVLMVIGSL